jgi:hypothetical protein
VTIREKLQAELAKPIPEDSYSLGANESFDPWGYIIEGISGSYNSESDRLMIGALEAIRDRSTYEFIEKEGFAGEFMLYVLSGHGFTDYGTSPRGGWPEYEIADLWDELIEKWKAYAAVAWSD